MKRLMTALIGIALISPMAYAKRGHHKAKHEEIFKQLDLSEKQRTELKALRENNKDNMKSLKEQKKKFRKEMNEAMASDASESQLRTLHNEITRLKNKIKDTRFEKMLSIRKILTQEQRVKFFKLKQEMKKNKRKGY